MGFNGQIANSIFRRRKSTLTLYTLADFVTVSPAQPVSIQVGTIAGASVPFNPSINRGGCR